jgi:hypothetical protein
MQSRLSPITKCATQQAIIAVPTPGLAQFSRLTLMPDFPGIRSPPLRLALGNDAVDAIAESLDSVKAELAAWERVGRSAVFD